MGQSNKENALECKDVCMKLDMQYLRMLREMIECGDLHNIRKSERSSRVSDAKEEK